MKDRKPAKQRKASEGKIIRLEDLAPRQVINGGVRKRLFGQESTPRIRRKPGGE